MHELSIAMSIVSAAEAGAKANNAVRIKKIYLQIGALSGIELDALDFAWPLATKNTMLETAEKFIEVIPAKAECLECKKEFDIQNPFDPCPHCGSYFKQYLRGKELKIKYIEIE